MHDKRDEAIYRYIPYFGLVVSVLLTLLVWPGTNGYTYIVLGLSALSAAWMHFMSTPYEGSEDRPLRAVVYYAGLIVLIGILIVLSPFFGFFGFTGYLHAAILPSRLRITAMVVTAFLMATTQVGGVQNLHGGTLAAYAALVLVNVVIAGTMTAQGIAERERSRQRAQMIEELGEANRRLRETMEENAGLHAQLVVQAHEAGILDERQRMAGEIHDTIAQGLAGIVTQLAAADQADADPERRRRHLELAARLARESLAEARRSVQALRPGPLAEAHLPEAIRDMAGKWSETSGVPVRVEVTGVPAPLPPALEVVLFRTAQEGLANIAKHAGASQARVTLSYTHELAMLDVVDDGAGFDTTQRGSDSYGLTAMRQRLHQVGGTLEIESRPGDGTAVSARVPALRAEGTPAEPVHGA